MWASRSAEDTVGAFLALRCIGRGTPLLAATYASVCVERHKLEVSNGVVIVYCSLVHGVPVLISHNDPCFPLVQVAG